MSDGSPRLSEAQRSEAVDWFEDFYAQAKGDARQVPWAHLSPRKELVEWAMEHQPDGTGQTALVVGCGLGDDAEFLAGLNYAVTAFDVSQTAVDWCKNRFPDSAVTYVAADMFKPPAEWSQAFDLVLEVYIVQALPPEIREASSVAIGQFVAEGGQLIAIGQGIPHAFQRMSGPPWPTTPDELALFENAGLAQISYDPKPDPRIEPIYRYRAVFERGD